MKNLKEKIRSGEVVHGCWINLASTVSAEIVGQAGFDWLLLDLEHGAGDVPIMYQQLQALSGSSSASIVRTDQLSRPKAQRILDAGADGIMFPQIQSAEEAGEAARMMYYPPRGTRGMAKMTRATGFGKYANEYINNLDQNLVGVIQIETLNAVQNIDSIAATEGVDVFLLVRQTLRCHWESWAAPSSLTRKRFGILPALERSMEGSWGAVAKCH